nr:V protein [Pohorje myodes paramyxovirus 1]
MANFSTSELNQLVQDGIKTVEFIQQAAKNPKETYGRSAIQKPRTKDRIKAWEGVTADHDYTGDKQDGMPGKEKGTKKRKGKGSPKDNRGVGDEEDSIKREPSTPSEASDIQDRDVKNTTDERAEDRGDTSSGLHQPGESSDPGSDGDTESARSLGDDSVSNADYRVILSADHESSAAETTDLPSNVTNVRPATTEDFAQIFEEGSSKAHRRLTGIAAYTDSDAAHKSAENPVKKGHRREYCIDTFGGHTIIREWCNPQCARVTATPAQFACSCGECPQRCAKCIDDRIYLQKLRDCIASSDP